MQADVLDDFLAVDGLFYVLHAQHGQPVLWLRMEAGRRAG
jgi:hypothetical protein